MNANEYDLQSAIIDTPDPADVSPDIRELVTTYTEHVDNWHTARNALYAAEEAVTRAPDLDAEALAQAIREGKKDPGTPHRDKAATDHAEAARQMAARHRVWFTADRELEPLLHKHAAWTITHAHQQYTEALTAYEKAIDHAEQIMTTAATTLEQSLALNGLAESLQDPRGYIGYDSTSQTERTNLTEARALIYRARRTANINKLANNPEHDTITT